MFGELDREFADFELDRGSKPRVAVCQYSFSLDVEHVTLASQVREVRRDEDILNSAVRFSHQQPETALSQFVDEPHRLWCLDMREDIEEAVPKTHSE